MEQVGKPDRKRYLTDLISHYELLLCSDSWRRNGFNNFILEEYRKCKKELWAIRECDTEAVMLVNAFACPSHIIN